MESFDRKKHWENIYQTKALTEVSWYQPRPETSLGFFHQFSVPLNARIIDVGGGDSLLVDHLLDLGYRNVTVLDISEGAIERAKKRLGERSVLVNWVVSDITEFRPDEKYDVWHDRAAFHFLTSEADIERYLEIAQNSITDEGLLIVGTFSEQGPKKCSGIEIRQYSEDSITNQLRKYFSKIECITVEHKTPSSAIQSFVFCSFRKAKAIAA